MSRLDKRVQMLNKISNSHRLTHEEHEAWSRARAEPYKGSPEKIRLVRERTGFGMYDAKTALIMCEGDVEKACALLPRVGLA